MKTRKGVLRNQKGFTLIEIIAVLVILGILSAVAIPKYMGLQDEARKAAAKGEIAEAKGRLSQSLGKYMLKNSGTKPTSTQLLTEVGSACPTTYAQDGEFWLKCADVTEGGQTIRVSAYIGTGSVADEVSTAATGALMDFNIGL